MHSIAINLAMSELSDRALDHSLARLGPYATPEARLEVLHHLLTYWHGDASNPPLGDLPPMPSALRLWYEWVGRESPVLNGQNQLLEPAELCVENGRLYFYRENQGSYFWATETEGMDPPVYGSPTIFSEWQAEGRFLSEHLIVSLMFERLIDAPYTAMASRVSAAALASVESTVPRLPISHWRWPDTHTVFHAGAGAFAMVIKNGPQQEEGGLHICARTRSPLAFLDGLEIDWDFRSFE